MSSKPADDNAPAGATTDAPLVASGLFWRLAVGLVLPVPVCVLSILGVGALDREVSPEKLAGFGKTALAVGGAFGLVPCLCYTALMERLHTLGVGFGQHLLASTALGLLTGLLFWPLAGGAAPWLPAHGAATGLLVGLVLWWLRASADERSRVRAPW